MRKLLFLLLFLVGFQPVLSGQENNGLLWEAGLRFNKAVGLYHENGFDLKVRPGAKRWAFSFQFYTSRAGTAFNSNAIAQDNYRLQADYAVIRSKNQRFQLDLGIHTGYFRADYGSEIFDVLDSSSPLLGLEIAPQLSFGPIVVECGAGYQFLHGKGTSGPGTLYPFYIHSGVRYRFKR